MEIIDRASARRVAAERCAKCGIEEPRSTSSALPSEQRPGDTLDDLRYRPEYVHKGSVNCQCLAEEHLHWMCTACGYWFPSRVS